MSEQEANEEYYLRLSSSKIKFEGVNKSGLVSVFYDESNSQVFNVLSGDVTEVHVKSFNPSLCHHFKMEERGQVLTIKFSPDQKILSLQRSKSALEFMTISNGRVVKEFTETFKSVNVLGCAWVSPNEVVVITDASVRLFRIDMDARTLNPIQNVNVKVCWFSFYSPLCVILISIQSQSNNEMLFLQIKSGQILSSKFTIDLDQRTRRPADRDVVLGLVYNKPRILVVNTQTVNSTIQREVVIYTVFKMSQVRKTHVLRLHDGGRVALNIVDNVIIVHQQLTPTSLIFDIYDAPNAEGVSYINPDVKPKSIQPYVEGDRVYEMYSASWIAFQPDVIIDVKAGCLWAIELNLPGFFNIISDPKRLVRFFLLRTDSREVTARALLTVAEDPSRLEELGDMFDQVNSVFRNLNDRKLKSITALPLSSCKYEEEEAAEYKTILDPAFINSQLFSPLLERISVEPSLTQRQQLRHLSWVLLEYIRSLADFLIPAPHFLCEILIDTLVKTKSFYQLYQLLQYRAVGDSKPLACLLLSLENLYPPATQLAIDMLERLGSARDEITEILLSNKQVLQSLRYALKHSGPQVRINPAKYLEPAKQMNDSSLYYSVMKQFDCQPTLSNGS